MNFGQAVTSCFSNYTTFSGKASRSEYWNWFLFILIGYTCALIADGRFPIGFYEYYSENPQTKMENIFTLVTILPSLAVSARRLRDVNKSGWWLLIIFTGLGILLFLYWALKPSFKK